MGGDAPQVPGPSAAEQALQAQQTKTLALQQSIIEKQMKEQELLAPILYKSMGIQPQYDDKGNITGFAEAPDPLKDQRKAIEAKFYERTQNALEGKLNVDPGLLQSLDEQEARVREQLRKQLGPGYETSSPGIEALSKFNLNRENILEGARRGDLTMAEQLGLAQNASNLGQQGQTFGQAMGLTGAPLASSSALQGVASGYGNAANALASDRYAQYQGQLAGYQADQKTFGSLMGGLGGLAGMALFAPTGGASTSLFGRLFK